MTVDEYIDSLIEQGFSEEEIKEKVKAFRANGNEMPTEEIENDFQEGLAPGVVVGPLPEAPPLAIGEIFPEQAVETPETTEFQLEDTSLESLDPNPKESDDWKTPEVLDLENQLKEAKEEYNADFSGKEFFDYTRKIRNIENQIKIEENKIFSGERFN